jgi:hypothetical protein
MPGWDTEPSIPCKRIKCPKCGGEPRILREIWEGHTIAFEYADGKRGREGMLGDGMPYEVRAECDCGHVWKLRGVLQITSIDR